MKYIIRKSMASIPLEGKISDTLNVENKVNNAPSINLVQQMTGIPVDGIIDYNGTEVPEGYEEVEDPILYSTEETIIGYFIKSDGTKKPVYRKFAETNVTATGNITLIETGSMDDLFDVTIYRKVTNNHEAFDMTKWWSVRSTGKITAVIETTGTYTCCVTYTKLTD